MSFGVWELGIILAIVALLFGTKKLRSIGTDMGGAIKGFRSAMKGDEQQAGEPAEAAGQVIEGDVDQAAEKGPDSN